LAQSTYVVPKPPPPRWVSLKEGTYDGNKIEDVTSAPLASRQGVVERRWEPNDVFWAYLAQVARVGPMARLRFAHHSRDEHRGARAPSVVDLGESISAEPFWGGTAADL